MLDLALLSEEAADHEEEKKEEEGQTVKEDESAGKPAVTNSELNDIEGMVSHSKFDDMD